MRNYFQKSETMNRILTITLIILAGLLIGFTSCQKEDVINESPNLELKFSMDTVLFDTVFSTIGSVTRDMRVYNPTDKTVKISSIELARGEASNFEINVDGVSGTSFDNVKIQPNDSLYVFVRVTVDPNDKNQPFVCQDSIRFVVNSNLQDVDLVAWGQNAHFYKDSLLRGDHVWNNDKPHVIYGYVIVDDTLNSSLTINEGAQIYLHKDAILGVDSSATLKINGTRENRVKIQGDRLEDWYEDVPGQWNSIWLAAGSKENEIHNTVIRNGVVGIRVDTLGNSPKPTLTLTNSIIDNMQGYGLVAQGSHVVVRNTVFSNCGEHAVILNIGGTYDFRHCTIGNYWNNNSRETASLALNNFYLYQGDTIARDLDKAYFGNSIVYGNIEEELVFSKTPQAEFNYSFENCLIKSGRNFDENENFIQCLNEEPFFREPSEYDYHLDSLISPAIDAGNLEVVQETGEFNLNYDLDGVSRVADQKPDLGAYEFVAGEED